jgi:hypothetical protein
LRRCAAPISRKLTSRWKLKDRSSLRIQKTFLNLNHGLNHGLQEIIGRGKLTSRWKTSGKFLTNPENLSSAGRPSDGNQVFRIVILEPEHQAAGRTILVVCKGLVCDMG